MVRGTVIFNNRNRLREIAKRVEELSHKEVLVGISQEESSRKLEHDGDKINNAELLYIHTHGSPIKNIPARPVLQPAIEDNKEIISDQLKLANQAALSGNPRRCEIELKKAGMLAEIFSKAWFENPRNGWQPNSPVTIAKKGSVLPLIDTGEMRKSITHVLRDK